MEVWIGRDGERHGPYTEADIKQWLASGEVSPADLGWYEGLADWQPLSVLFPDMAAATSTAEPAIMPPPLSAPVLNDYASFWKRVAAWLIDLLVLIIPCLVISYALGAIDAYRHLLQQVQAGTDAMAAFQTYAVAVRPASLGTIVFGFAYYVLFECSAWQATPGKKALDLRVTDLHGARLTIGRSLARNAIRLVSAITGLIPFVFYLAVAWTRRKQGLHDLIAGTLVVNGHARDTETRTSSGPGNTFSA